MREGGILCHTIDGDRRSKSLEKRRGRTAPLLNILLPLFFSFRPFLSLPQYWPWLATVWAEKAKHSRSHAHTQAAAAAAATQQEEKRTGQQPKGGLFSGATPALHWAVAGGRHLGGHHWHLALALDTLRGPTSHRRWPRIGIFLLT